MIAKRIILRLEPAGEHEAALVRALRLAKAFHAELAARMIADTRLATAVAVTGADLDRHLRRAETKLRRDVSGISTRENARWTFEVVHCAGILARDVMASDDLVAIELPRIEVSLADLREEIAEALAHARGVLLLPAELQTEHGPVVVVVDRRDQAKALIEQSDQIADALGVPLKLVERTPPPAPGRPERHETADVATAVRRLDPLLAVIDAADPIVQAFLARPRFVREIATPVLLLNA